MQIVDGARAGRTWARATRSVYFCFGGNLAGKDAIVDAPGSPENIVAGFLPTDILDCYITAEVLFKSIVTTRLKFSFFLRKWE